MAGAANWKWDEYELLPCSWAARFPPCRLRTASSSARCWPRTPAAPCSAGRCSPAASAAPSPTSSHWMNCESQGAIRWLHLIILCIITLYLTANSSARGACLPMIHCYKIKHTQTCVRPPAIACLRRRQALTASAKTKGSANSSSNDLCFWKSSPAVKAGCGVELTAGTSTVCKQGFCSGAVLVSARLQSGAAVPRWAPAAVPACGPATWAAKWRYTWANRTVIQNWRCQGVDATYIWFFFNA